MNIAQNFHKLRTNLAYYGNNCHGNQPTVAECNIWLFSILIDCIPLAELIFQRQKLSKYKQNVVNVKNATTEKKTTKYDENSIKYQSEKNMVYLSCLS